MPPQKGDFLALVQIPTDEKEVINHGSSLQRNIKIKYQFNPQRDWIYAMLLQKEYVNLSLSPRTNLKAHIHLWTHLNKTHKTPQK